MKFSHWQEFVPHRMPSLPYNHSNGQAVATFNTLYFFGSFIVSLVIQLPFPQDLGNALALYDQ